MLGALTPSPRIQDGWAAGAAGELAGRTVPFWPPCMPP
nr:hypothetical protein RVX_0473 [Nitratidesulfovibrio sp. HK-II]